MKKAMFHPSCTTGRPRAVVLSPEQEGELARIYLRTNRTHDQGSMEMAWVLFTEGEIGGEHAWTVENRRVAKRLPTAALEVMRRARVLVGAARGGSKRLRSEGPYVAGSMRIHQSGERRLLAGERYSVDDLTRNVPCWIPWPWGGCKCSDKFGVRLGRWQTLAVLDDASETLVATKSVFRYEQSYRGADAAAVIFQVESEIGMRGFGPGESHWVVEGGVWQSEQMLAALGGRFVSAKGRPNQKLIERWFGTMQTRDSVNFGDVGRIRGEKMEENALYLSCRRGEKDPRKHFLGLDEGQAALDDTIAWMNTREVRSRTYGRWVPLERWENDLADHPLVTRDAADAWVMSPERRRLKVSRKAMLSCQAVGPHGVSMPLAFGAPWLWEHAGRQVDLYFDPLGEWPITGHVACPRTRRLLGSVTCQAAFGMSRDRDAEMAAAIRKTMMAELRCIVGSKRVVREVRGIDGAGKREAAREETFHRSEFDRLAIREKNHGERDAAAVLEPRHSTVAVDPLISAAGRLAVEGRDSGGSRGIPPEPGGRDAAVSRSLSRRAAEARARTPNF
jgi:hypothetical protein